ncbi:MAG: sigma-70 family RNA polymerase sigma factor [Alphaproteobacteria bacterium]|nr:sigma-70 family RNA polymerase sigma factor [Alphaproteobacteria bacterium]
MRRYAGLVAAAVRGVAREATEVEDLAQEVFLRLCKDDFRLLRSYDPARAGLSTWITIVARSTARDAMRRHRPVLVEIDAVPEGRFAVDPVEPAQKLKLPEALLSPRQREILTMLYDREMEVAEIAEALGIDPQTVRSAHHKAMVKLRAHFKAEAE